jgi:hypothetical protein
MVFRPQQIPPKGPARDELIEKIAKLREQKVTYNNIALRLDIPFGSISRLLKEHKESQNANE